jgi:hypothetical protein
MDWEMPAGAAPVPGMGYAAKDEEKARELG